EIDMNKGTLIFDLGACSQFQQRRFVAIRGPRPEKENGDSRRSIFQTRRFRGIISPSKKSPENDDMPFSGIGASNAPNPYGSGLCNEGSFPDAGAHSARVSRFLFARKIMRRPLQNILLLLSAAIFAASSARADVKLPAIISDGMV